VLPLQNLSGDPKHAWLAVALAEMMMTELEADPHLRVVSGGNVARAQRSVRSEQTDDLESLTKLNKILAADLLVVGSYSMLGEGDHSQIRLDLRVLVGPQWDAVSAFAEKGNEQELFDLVSRAGERLRSALGGPKLSPQQVQANQAQRLANTDAARLHAEGLDRMRAFDFLGARDLLQEAVAADPGSARIHSALAEVWSELGYDAEAAQAAQKALGLAARLPQAERLPIQARYHEARKQWGQAAAIYRSLWTFFPDDPEYGLQLANSLSAAGRGREARLVIEELRRLPEPEGADPRIDLAEAQIALRLAEHAVQMRAADRAAAKGREISESQVVAQALALKGDALLFTGHPREAMVEFQQARRPISASLCAR
jgi:tetratricopeptide (TPR) repeat protein